MFTGIIEDLGVISHIEKKETNITYTIESLISKDLKVDQSVAHNGVCLTVVVQDNTVHQVTAINETLLKTNLKNWQVGQHVNLERAMILGARLDGHLVQGHVDTTATCIDYLEVAGSWVYTFLFDKKFAALVIEKGSICINGTSLTCFNLTNSTLQVAIVPYTFEHTIFKYLKVNDIVNMEFDILGKYFQRNIDLKTN
jgi:riboflavin synthase